LDCRSIDAAARQPGKLTTSGDLCRVSVVEQHKVLGAFRASRDTTPYRYLHALRLEGAREALLASDADAGTVMRVAMRFGFRELGRFAVDVEQRFRESSSETLRRTSPNGAFTSQCQDV
jgi:AraC family ethanolamine operon transcriptional activator